MGEENSGADTNSEVNKPDGEQQPDGGGADQNGQENKDKNNSDDEIDATDDGSAPVVRKTNQDYIQERLAKKAAKNQDGNKKDDDNSNNDDDEGDDAMSAADEEAIARVVEKNYGHQFEAVEKQTDEQELNQVFEEIPELKPFKAKIERYWGDKTRRHLPAMTVALEAVGAKTLLRIGAKRAKVADTKADTASNSGDGSRTVDEKPVEEMTTEEFLAKKREIMSRRRDS